MTERPAGDESPYLSIVIPAYNEERRLPATLQRLHAYLCQRPYTWEIHVVSNGCTDDTDGVVRRAQARIPNLHLTSVRERGKGLACKDGALRSRGQVIFLCDADLSMPPEELAGFIAMLDSADVVVGSREAPGAHRYREPWVRHLMGRGFNWLVRLLLVPGIRDTQCGFKAFRRAAARELFGKQAVVGWGFDVELLFLARKRGCAVRELPIDWYFDADTRVRPGVDSLRMVGEVILVRLADALGVYRSRAATPGTRREDIAR
ncbi:MAG: glycosyltransferase family 2 protein [Chloroflexi bacterium]|nr:glycosyltransferase family 2 protein [Chloroflexota bacterium]